MTPGDRRAAILAATIPLLRERGVQVTTRELAEAAGVAEGTLFRVFPDKAAIVHAALAQALDPSPLVAEMAAVSTADDVRATIESVIRLVHSRSLEVAALFAMATQLQAPDAGAHHAPGRGRHKAHLEPVVAAVAAMLDPHEESLRRPPEVCARMLVASVLAATGPLMGDTPLTSDDVVALTLDGVLAGGAPC